MIRSSALYISLIISILIVLICGALLMIGFTYKMFERKQNRLRVLKENVASGTLMVLQKEFKTDTSMRISLFGQDRDSVLLEKRSWGIYEIGVVKSWIQQDSVGTAFMIGAMPTDTLKVLYLTDEDRPMSITGESMIKGTAYLPKSGIKAGYVESYGYKDKTLVYGSIKSSGRNLPKPDMELIGRISDLSDLAIDSTAQLPDSIRNSFTHKPARFHFPKEVLLPNGFSAKGNVIISSDSLIVVAEGSLLDKVILMAPEVRIGKKFRGNLQVFATDSILLGDSTQLTYPSALVLIKNDSAKFQALIKVGKDVRISGQLFAYEGERSLLMPIISIGERTLIKGEIWCQGYVGLNKKAVIHGSVSAIRLIANVGAAIYENYLIDVRLDKKALSKYYLSSVLLNAESNKGKVLCRLE
ncbi:hypothetical protein [Pedobacter psychroterrae]|uniref:Cytoskeletal protein CcmA (Bactofilin family) n=1 Tax=Pedobacter psychroterrae TaxID=2530453 RepID=A0A4R0NGU4_9SPHI|nr:hypothetical protein [Pedobacter psychroterrae]TCC99770.1 hypothetical protein EZ437_16140 [Pedobacter psychroterrae]